MLAPLDQEKIALSRFSFSCVSVFGTGGLSIPTLRPQVHATTPNFQAILL
jgi:hypothetical protein